MVDTASIRDILGTIPLQDPRFASCFEMAIAQAIREIEICWGRLSIAPDDQRAMRRLRRGLRPSNLRAQIPEPPIPPFSMIEDPVKWALYLAESGDPRFAREYLKAMGPHRGRPSEMSRRDVIRKLATVYCAATGEQLRLPSWSYKRRRHGGAFFGFCRTVFDLAGGRITDLALAQAVKRALRGWSVPEPATSHVLAMFSTSQDQNFARPKDIGTFPLADPDPLPSP